ncbi:MAG: AI-2E family transporter [Candidatus Sungbacteria bacterium]|nr:AI-2E family transporter [Candidatus Sungbacteria bacterium]
MPARDLQHISIPALTILRFFAVVLLLVGLYLVLDIIAALFFAVIIASALQPAISWMTDRSLPRILAVVLIYLMIAMGVAGLAYFIVPLLMEELRGFAAVYPSLVAQAHLGLNQVGQLPFFSLFAPDIGGGFDFAFERFGGLADGFLSAASAAFGGVFSFVLVLVFSFYLAAQEKGIENFLRLMMPLAYEPYMLDLWERSQKKLGKWLRTQMLLGTLVGVLIFFGLTLLGVRHAFFFALIAGVFEIIPIVGPILAAVPVVATALLTSPFLGVLTIALYVAIQQIESHVIVPVVMRRTVGLSPLVVVLALLIGGRLGGIFGILLAVPLTAIAAELLNDWDKKKRALIPE